MNAKILTSVILVGALSTACKSSDDAKAAQVDPAVMQAKWLEYGTPGPAHQKLADKVGRWKLNVTHFMPGQPPSQSDATSEIKWALDGRFLVDNMSGNMMGMPFNGMGMTGYDNMKKVYFVTWADNMGTGLTYMEGKYDAENRTFTYEGKMADPVSGEFMKSRIVEKELDRDHWTMQLFMEQDGDMQKGMEIAYTRTK